MRRGVRRTGGQVSFLERVIATRAVIADKARWTQHVFRETVNGEMCYCLGGAAQKASATPWPPGGWVDFETREFLAELSSYLPHPPPEPEYGAVFLFNDDNTHARVIDWLDGVITKLTEEANANQ